MRFCDALHRVARRLVRPSTRSKHFIFPVNSLLYTTEAKAGFIFNYEKY